MKISRSTFFVLFTVSGFAGLIYESIWSHYLKLFLGHAAYAQTLVLVIFMGGMAAGARLCAARTVRWRNLLMGYAAAEFVIGVMAIAFHWIFVNATGLAYDVILPSLGSPATIAAAKWSIAAALILPQSILLGMTFPLMSAGIMRRFPDTPGSSLAMLYFTNSLGAAAGVLVSGFFLIEKVGMPGTMLTAGLLNLALAACIWAICRNDKPGEAPDGALRQAAPVGERRFLHLMLGAALLTGAASFCYEIGWIRMLSLVLGSSTHAFEIMLSAFILGLAFGGLWIRRSIDRNRDVAGILGLVILAKGLLALATLPVYGNSFEVMRLAVTSLAKTDFSYTLFNLASHAISLSVMFPAAFCAGMSLPLITVALLRNGFGEESIGKVYAWNTFGAIIGVIAAVHLAMPLLGLKGLIVCGAATDLLVALAVLRRAAGSGSRRRVAGSLAAGAAALLVAGLAVNLDSLKMASGVYRTGTLETPGTTETVFHRDGKTATIDVLRYGSVLSIRTNGKTDAALQTGQGLPNPDEYTMVLAAVMAMAHQPGARTVANIGLGSGLTAHTLLGNADLQAVDTIEIEPAMVEGARQFGARVERAFDDPRSHIFIDDAKSFFAGRNSRYDVIVSEPSNPWVSGVSSLFSGEFYSRVRHHLNEGGVFVQWMQAYEIRADLVASIVTALGNNFSDYVMYETDGGNLILVATPHGKLPPPDAAVFRHAALRSDLAPLGVAGIADLQIRRIGSRQVLQDLILSYGAPANSDYFPIVDLQAPKARFLQQDARELVALELAPVPVQEFLDPAARIGYTATGVEAPPSPRALRAGLAREMLDFLKSGSFALSPGLDADTRVNLAFVRETLLQCTRSADDRLWFGSLLSAGQSISNLLPPEASAPLWRSFETARCHGSLRESDRQWLALFKAIAERDGARTAQLSDQLLQGGAATDRPQVEYLVMASMAGHVAAADRGAARATWSAYGPAMLVGRAPSPTWRLLYLAAQEKRG